MPALNLKLVEVEKVAAWAREHDELEIAQKAEALTQPQPVAPISGQIDIFGSVAA